MKEVEEEEDAGEEDSTEDDDQQSSRKKAKKAMAMEDSSEDDDQQNSRKKAKQATAKVPNYASSPPAATTAFANPPHAWSLSAATTASDAGLALIRFSL